MNDEPAAPRNPSNQPKHGASFRDSSAMKWIAGGVAALVLVGGGYAAWNAFGDRERGEQTAYDPAPYASPLSQDEQDFASADDPGMDPTEAETSSEPGAAPPPRRTARAPEPIPEATIGVLPASEGGGVTTTAETDEIVVPGIRRPVWSRTPNPRRLASYYPDRALESGREGQASLACVVQNNGALDCRRVSEYPRHAGFGTAALRVARTYRHAPERADGSPAAGTPVNLRVLFRLEEDRRTAASLR